jgi:hypothetical protein
MISFTTNHTPLGDCLCVLLGLENYCTVNGIKANINGYSIYKELTDIFHFEHITLKKDIGINLDPWFHSMMMNSYVKNKNKCLPWGWLMSEVIAKQLGGKWGEIYNIPVYKGIKNPKEDITLVQFDSQSAKYWSTLPHLNFKKPFTKKEINLIIKKHAKTPVAAIGGNDTVPYLNIEHRRGNLHYICKQLSGCKTFLGCDSGVSHLASIMNVDTKVVAIARSACVRKYYSLYGNVEVLEREQISLL